MNKIFVSNKFLFCVLFLMIYAPVKAESLNESNFHKRIPLSESFWKLFREQSVIGRFDCSNKCGRYVRLLRAEGIKADIVVIRPHTGRLLHAVVKVTQEDGRVRFLDPTKGITSYDLSVMGDYKETIAFADLLSRGKQFL